MANISKYSLRSALLVSCYLVALSLSSISVHALNIGIQRADSAISVVRSLIISTFSLCFPLFFFPRLTIIIRNFLDLSQSKECSRKCESEFCSGMHILVLHIYICIKFLINHRVILWADCCWLLWMTVPPFLRYGKYCGLLYSGCPGERPCDGLDACCMKHDACVQAKNSKFIRDNWQLLRICFKL